MKSINPLDIEFRVYKSTANGEWHWNAFNHADRARSPIANNAEGHKRKKYTLLRALAMANGRDVYVEDPKSRELMRVGVDREGKIVPATV